ncbi:MAG: hypothetical protein ABFR89_05450 [Actinomycetota bacterium]
MKRSPMLSLEAALMRCGVNGCVDEYDGVAVRLVPGWLERLWGSGVEAMTLPWAVYVSERTFEHVDDGRASALLIHEATHVDQWRSHGAVRFVSRYVGDYLRGRAVGLPHDTAYRAIRFEREARSRAGQR